MDPAHERSAGITFGRFQVLPNRREVLADGRPIKLGGRAFDLLITLIEGRGAVVHKDALMARIWPDRVVEENNLTAQVKALRAALGAERDVIRTVSGRGYQFTGEIRVLSAGPPDQRAGAGAAAAEPEADLPPTNVPEPVSELIGRDEELSEILDLAGAHRLVTLTGAGGIGKTTLALALARELRPHFADGVWLAEFSALADPGLVPATVAAAVGLELAGGEVSAQRVAQALADRRLLLMLDTCEHVIDAGATLAEAVLRAGSAAHIITTSREPLRAEGEQIYPVPPLAVPAVENENPWRHGAVLLFVIRSRAAGAHVSKDRQLAPVIAAICRQLDGLPLAIELAAARAATLGIEELASRLDDRFRLLTGGRRTALPRHQALRATLDWSYELLAEPERGVLRRLAVFAGAFSLEAATAVAASPELAVRDVVEGLLGLVAKSLVVAGGAGAVARYRLLDTTRAYALEKLEESGERERLSHHHAEYYRQLFERAEIEWETRPTVEWLNDYSWCVDNLRAALDWAYSPKGEASIGVALTIAAVPLWMQLSLLDECRGRAEQAIAICNTDEGGDPRREMKLYAALATSSYWRGARIFAPVSVLWTKALEIAESLDDAEYQLRSLWGLYSRYVNTSDFQLALEMAQRFRTLAAKQQRRNDELIGDRLLGLVQHLLGDQASARRHFEHMLANFILSDQRSQETIRFQLDQRVAARAYLARILWFQGFPDQAMRTAKDAVDEAREINHVVSLCYALAVGACPVMLWVEDLAAAERYIGMLLDHSARYAMPSWGALDRIFEAALLTKRGELSSVPGLRQLRVDFEELGARPDWISANFLNQLAAGFARVGQIADGLAAVEQAIERAERTEARWLFPESLRIRGELLLLQTTTGAPAAAADHFRQALDWARRQGALSLELRAATSLARLRRDEGRPEEGMALLRPIYDRFTEGFDTTDLKTADELLRALQD